MHTIVSRTHPCWPFQIPQDLADLLGSLELGIYARPLVELGARGVSDLRAMDSADLEQLRMPLIARKRLLGAVAASASSSSSGLQSQSHAALYPYPVRVTLDGRASRDPQSFAGYVDRGNPTLR